MPETEKIETTKLSEEQISNATEVKIWDEVGKEVRFGDLFETQKIVVVFISSYDLLDLSIRSKNKFGT